MIKKHWKNAYQMEFPLQIVMKDFSASFLSLSAKIVHIPATNFSRPRIIFWGLF
jgi:hypothetical protein